MTTLDELDQRRPPAGMFGWTAFGFGVGYGLGRMLISIGVRSLPKYVRGNLAAWARRLRTPSRASAFRRPGEIPPGAIMTAAFVLVALSSFLLGVWLF